MKLLSFNSKPILRFLKVICSILVFLPFFISTNTFANNFDPQSPKPPNIPTPSGLQENDDSSSISSLISSLTNSTQNSISNSAILFSNFSNSSSSNSFQITNSSVFSNQILVNSSSISSNVSFSNSQISLPEISQDATVRSGGFSWFLLIFVIIVATFGFRYRQILKNRSLQTVEKKIK